MKSYPVFILGTVLFFGLMLLWLALARSDEFSRHQHVIASQTTAGVADEISRVIRERQRLVRLFGREQENLLARLIARPADLPLQQQVEQKLRDYFPDYFAFTLASTSGIPLLDDFDNKVGEVCQHDILAFARSDSYRPRIHPNPGAYHFDVMTRSRDGRHILFVSFRAELLGEILNYVQPPGHELMLVLPGQPPLIEVTARGPRSNLARDDYRLQEQELTRVLQRRHVRFTSWDILDLAGATLFADSRHQLVLQSLLAFVPFLLFALFMLYLYRRSERQRRRAESSRDEFLSTVSHELRTPLTAIHGALGLVANDVAGAIPDKARELVTIAEKNSQRLILLVNDLLDMRKLESGKMPFDMQALDLVAVIEHSIEETRDFARPYEIDYKFETPFRPCRVVADPQRLQQVMVNLLSNAAKYGQPGTPVRITIDPRDGMIRVSVHNLGPAIPLQFQSRLFDKFTQADAADSRSSTGSGLGLSIVKAIIEGHAGRIGFHSDPVRGTTFYFDLPAAEPASREAREDAPEDKRT